MSDTGTITEIEPEDGLGWIEMQDKSRVRFGGTACKTFVPAVGMVVRVLGTRPGYKGVLKATELERVADAPKEFAAASGSAPVPEPRTSLHTIQSSGVPADDLLLAVLGRADVDDTLHADLGAISFDVHAAPGLEIGCKNPWFYGVARDAAGNALGLYAHPMYEGHSAPPWLRWDQASNTLRFVAVDTATLFPVLLATAAAAGVDAATVTRLHGNLVKLGMPDEQGHAHAGGDKVEWLPPDDAELRSLAEYLGESDGGEMERGLIAYAFGRGDAQAEEALRSIYTTWEWSLPSWVG